MFEKFGQDLILLEKIASGGMGEVYRAKQLGKAGFDKTVAVKMILPHYASHPDFKLMFEQEMRLCSRLQHPNVAQVFTSGEYNGYLYLVMEFLDGQTARDLIQTCKAQNIPIPFELNSLICSEVARGLSYVHAIVNEDTGERLNLVHRDISPQNIMIGYNGEVKILDFGVAKAADSIDITKAGDLKGNLAYIAPEAIDDLKLDGRADLFSLGAIAYEFASLEKLFAGKSPIETINKVRYNEILNLQTAIPQTPTEFERIVMKMLERDREVRYQSADELHRELSAYISKDFPKLVSTDLGLFLARCFSEQRKQTLEERACTNSLWTEKKEIILQSIQTNTGLHASLRGLQASFSTDETVVGQSALHANRKNQFRSSFLLKLAATILILSVLTLTFLSEISSFIFNQQTIAIFKSDSLALNSSISKWPSITQPVITASQEEPISRPLVSHIGDSNKLGLHFDGVDDFLLSNQLAQEISTREEFSVIMIAKASSFKRQTFWALYFEDRESDFVRLFIEKDNRIGIKCDKLIGQGYTYSLPQDLSTLSILTTVVGKDYAEVFLNSIPIVKVRIYIPLDYRNIKLFSIGQDYDSFKTSDFLDGDIADLAIYPNSLNKVDRRKQETLYADKYNIKLGD